MSISSSTNDTLQTTHGPGHDPAHPPVDYSRKWLVMSATAMGIFLATIDGSIVNVALPTLVREFNTDLAAVEWVVLAYLLVTATLLLSMGRLGDMVGKKAVYTAGFVVFTVGSLLCGLAPSIGFLVAARVLQAVGAAMLMSLGTAIVTEAFPPSERGTALGISGALVSLGIIVGPTLGGVLVGLLSWHWIFFVNLPVGLAGTLMAARFIPLTRGHPGQRFDYAGAATLFVSLFALLSALALAQDLGFGHPAILALFAAATVLVLTFILIESRAEHPMVRLELFRNETFSVNLVTAVCVFVSMSGMSFLLPFYLQGMLGYGPAQAGLLMLVTPLSMGLMSPVSGWLSDRFGCRTISTAGLAMLVIGYLGISTLDTSVSAIGYVLRFVPVGLGIGLFQSPNNSAIMGEAPRTQLGVASGMLSLTRVLGQITGISTMGALWTSRSAAYAGSALPGGAPQAPIAAQMLGLHDVFLSVLALACAAFILAAWMLITRRPPGRAGILPAPRAGGPAVGPHGPTP
jgi:EmrB/QacA subfamily drug resistance transporter